MTGRTTSLRRAFAGRRVLVTGHTGFKGSWLAFWLLRLGARVTGIALPPAHDPSHFALLGLDRRMDHVVGDVRDGDAVMEVFARHRPEIVFHLAAQAIVRQGYAEPKTTFDTNVGGTVNVLEAVRRHEGVRSLVLVTSDKCYANREWVWGYRENDALGGDDPYSASKAASEMVFNAYRRSFFEGRTDLGVASARAGNVIGGGDWAPDRLLPDCIRAFEAGRPLVLRSPGSTRPWQHVLDPLHGYLVLAAALLDDPARRGGSWNFGPDPSGGAATTRDVAERAAAMWGRGAEVLAAADAGAFREQNLLQLNIDKARSALGWAPRWSSVTAVDRAVAWYKAVLGGAEACDVTAGQIDEFEGGVP